MEKKSVEILKRTFVDGKTNQKYPDINPVYTPDQVRDFYSNQFPHLVNASIDGPEIKKDEIVYTFTVNLGTKG
jgi:PRTRC genetic system protein C